jgi:hypothetical protein
LDGYWLIWPSGFISITSGNWLNHYLDKWATDGASLTGALFGGWILALLYFLSWLTIGWIAKKLRVFKAQNH